MGNMHMKWFLCAAALLGLSSVIMGAAADHLMDVPTEAFMIGQRYHQLYSIVLLALSLYGLQTPCSKFLGFSTLAFFAGTVIFSGSLYASILLNVPKLTYMTPVGGLTLMLGWALLAVYALRYRKNHYLSDN